MKRIRRNAFTALLLAAFLAPPLYADTIGDASGALRAHDYQRARSLVIQYYNQGGTRRYRADFIRAVSECKLNRGAQGPLALLKRLPSDYYLTAAITSEVNSWITYCSYKPQPTNQLANNGVGVSVSGLGSEPEVDSVAGAEPQTLPRMSPLRHGVAYRGDDFAWPTRSSPEACQRSCQLRSNCRSMTYDKDEKICWLKRSVPAVGYSDNYVSSRKIDN